MKPILIVALALAGGYASASTFECWNHGFYRPADTYRFEADVTGGARSNQNLGGPRGVGSNLVPVKVCATNNSDQPRHFLVKTAPYRSLCINNGQRQLIDFHGNQFLTPVLQPGESHELTFQMEVYIRVTPPASNYPNDFNHHSFRHDGELLVLANTAGQRFQLLDGDNFNIQLDRVNLEAQLAGEIPYLGGTNSTHPSPRLLTLAPRAQVPIVHLYAAPATAPDRPGAIPEEELEACSGCDQSGICTEAATASLSYRISFPGDAFDGRQSMLLKAGAPHRRLTHPNALQLDAEIAQVRLADLLRQAKTATEVALFAIGARTPTRSGSTTSPTPVPRTPTASIRRPPRHRTPPSSWRTLRPVPATTGSSSRAPPGAMSR